MPRHPETIPSLKRHKGSGQAYVNANRRRIYLGEHGAPDTEQRYAAWLAEYLAAGKRLRPGPREVVTITTLGAAFYAWALDVDPTVPQRGSTRASRRPWPVPASSMAACQ
jgi:hypothetical protein